MMDQQPVLEQLASGIVANAVPSYGSSHPVVPRDHEAGLLIEVLQQPQIKSSLLETMLLHPCHQMMHTCIILLNRSGSFNKAILERMGVVLQPRILLPGTSIKTSV